MTAPSALRYAGLGILEALQEAKNYNRYLADLVECGSGGFRRAVDFGAGIGTFSKLLRDRGFEIQCVEIDSCLAERLRGDGFITLPDIAGYADESIDYLFSLNVFEHIKDDRVVLAQLAKKIRPGGRLMIYVPAFASLWTSLDERVHHHRRYTRRSLRSLVESTALHVEECRYADSLGYFAALLFKVFGNTSGDLTSGTVRFYDRFAMPFSSALDRLAGRVLGKNVYVTCSKG